MSATLDDLQIKLHSEILKHCEPKDETKPQAVIYGLDSYNVYYISIATARKILSQDEDGNPVRTNANGNSHVASPKEIQGKVFYKNLTTTMGANPFIEQSVYQMSAVLGNKIVAPTRLLFVKIPQKNGFLMFAVQASLDAGHDKTEIVGFDEILNIPSRMKILKESMGQKFIQDLPDLLSETYFDEGLRQIGYSSNQPLNSTVKLFLRLLQGYPSESWPQLFKSIHKSQYEKVRVQLQQKQKFASEKELKDAIEQELSKLYEEALLKFSQELLNKNAFSVFVLLEQYPALRGIQLDELFKVPRFFKLLNTLFPVNSSFRTDTNKLVQAAENIFNYFNKEQLDYHFVLSLLSEPEDHKADNFVVRICHHPEKKHFLEMVAIDNDHAMLGLFDVCEKTRLVDDVLVQHKPRLRTVLFGMPSFLDSTLSSALAEKLRKIAPEEFILKWLRGLGEYYQPYTFWIEKDKHFAQCFHEMGFHLPMIESSTVRIFERFKKIQQFISRQDKVISLKQVLLQVEPILGHYYVALSRHFPDPVEFMHKLFSHGVSTYDPSLTIEKLLEKELASSLSMEQKSVLEPIKASPNPKNQSYIDTICGFIHSQGLCEIQDSNKNSAQVEVVRLLAWMKKTFNRSLEIKNLIISETAFIELMRIGPKEIVQWLMDDCQAVLLKLEGNKNPSINRDKVPSSLSLKEACMVYHAMAIPDINLKLFSALLQFQSHTYMLVEQKEFNELSSQAVQFFYHYCRLEPDLCQQLLRQNPELAWKLTLLELSEEKANADKIVVTGIEGIRYLKSEVYKKIFKGSEEFPKEIDYGQHNVTVIHSSVTEKIELSVHLKENPSFPAREILVHCLARKLLGIITPPVTLLRFSKKQRTFTNLFQEREVAYPVLATQTIPGKNISEVLETDPEVYQKIDWRSFSEAVALAMIINPEDGREVNYILSPFVQDGRIHYRIVSIDNDHAFIQPLAMKNDGTEIEGPKGLQVKTILFCMDLMGKALHPDVIKRLLNISPYEFVKEWLKDLDIWQKSQIQRVFSDKERFDLANLGNKNKICLDLKMRTSVMTNVLQKLTRLQKKLRSDPNATAMKLLSRVIPELGYRYKNAFKHNGTATDRFEYITKGVFVKRTTKAGGSEHWGTTTTSGQLLDMSRDLRKEGIDKKEEQEESVERLLEQLEMIKAENSKLQEIHAELMTGKWERFTKLLSDQQELVFNGNKSEFPGFDFALLKRKDGSPDVAAQQKVLGIIQKIPFRRLRLLNCEALTDENLSKFLRSFKWLSSLELRHCTKLTDRAVLNISLACPALEKLGLEGLPLIRKVSDLQFPALRVLQIMNCDYLLTINVNNLSRLELVNCINLSQITGKFSSLEILILKNCNLIHTALYEKYPILLELPLGRKFVKFVETLIRTVEISCEELGLELRQNLSPQIFDLLSKILNFFENVLKQVSGQDMIEILLKSLRNNYWPRNGNASKIISNLVIPPARRKVVVETLFNALKSPDVYMRANANKALDKLGIALEQRSAALVEIEIKYLESSIFSAKEASVETLSQLIIPPEKRVAVVDTLINSLKSNSDSWIGQNIRDIIALSKFIIPSERLVDVVDLLLKIIKDYPKEIDKAHACVALGKLAIPSERIMVVIDALLNAMKIDNLISLRAGEALGNIKIPAGNETVVVQALLEALKDGNTILRKHVCQALGKLAIPSKQFAAVITALLYALKDKEGEVRRNASYTLGALAIPCEMTAFVIKTLLNALKEKDNISYYLREVLNKPFILSEQSTAEVEILFDALKDENFAVREFAREILGRLALSPGQRIFVVDVLLGYLKSKEWLVKASAFVALSKLSIPLDRLELVLNAILFVMKDENPRVRATAIEALGKFTPPSERMIVIVDALLAALNDVDENVRAYASEALGRFILPRERRIAVTDALIKCMKDIEEIVRQRAGEALKKFAIPVERLDVVIDVWLNTLKDNDEYVRKHASEALCNLVLSPERQNVVTERLLNVLKDEKWNIRIIAIETLSKFFIPLEKRVDVVNALLLVMKDKERLVRASVSEALGKMVIPVICEVAVVDALLTVLYDPDLSLQMIAVATLSKVIIPRVQVRNLVCRLLLVLENGFPGDIGEVLVPLTRSPGKLSQIMGLLFNVLSEENLNERLRVYLPGVIEKYILPPKLTTSMVEILLNALKEKSEYARKGAIKILSKVTIPSAQIIDVVQAMLSALEYGDWDEKSEIRQSFRNLIFPPEQEHAAVEVFLKALKKDDEYVEGIAGDVVGMLAPPGEVKTTVEISLKPSKEGIKYVREVVLEALGKLTIPSEKIESVVELLIKDFINDPNDNIRASASAILSKLLRIPQNVSKVVPKLVVLLNDGPEVARLEAVALLQPLTCSEYYLSLFKQWMQDIYSKEVVSSKIKMMPKLQVQAREQKREKESTHVESGQALLFSVPETVSYPAPQITPGTLQRTSQQRLLFTG